MKISILILTHNRPKLFERAIKSVLNNLPEYEIEILVNNDSHDIEQIFDDRVNIKYYYKSNNDISTLYEFLFREAKGSYIYFLEDDDYIRANFFNDLDFDYDINYFHYVSDPHVKEVGPLCALKRQKLNQHLVSETNYTRFIAGYDDTYFQLGQIIFRRDKLAKFPLGNHINNDIVMFKSFDVPSTIKYITKQLWVQTTDGGDNISFDNLNTDDRFR